MQRKTTLPRRAELHRENLHHILAQDIGARILKGEFAPGSLLPREAEWGRSFGVSRTAVREAIKMLMAKGLIVSRPKIGSRVQPRSSWNLLDRDVLAWYCAATDYRHFLASVQQVRRILEPEAAALAASNHTPAQLADIEAAFVDMRLADSVGAWNAADVRFHLAILAAAGNELLVPLDSSSNPRSAICSTIRRPITRICARRCRCMKISCARSGSTGPRRRAWRPGGCSAIPTGSSD